MKFLSPALCILSLLESLCRAQTAVDGVPSADDSYAAGEDSSSSSWQDALGVMTGTEQPQQQGSTLLSPDGGGTTTTVSSTASAVKIFNVDGEGGSPSHEAPSSSPFLRHRAGDMDRPPWSLDRSSSSSSIWMATGDACADQASCEDCVAKSYWCHWCEKQGTCHSKGSFYGCFSGSQCAKNSTVDPNDEHGCSAHRTCGDCATASRFCHWCGHDQACHAIGSVYGCTVGVDCYSNDRCKRPEPEKIKAKVVSLDQLSPLPLLVVSIFALVVCCCASICFCICTGVKGAYDDLVVSAANPGGGAPDGLSEPLLGNISQPTEDENQNDESANSNDDDDGEGGGGGGELEMADAEAPQNLVGNDEPDGGSVADPEEEKEEEEEVSATEMEETDDSDRNNAAGITNDPPVNEMDPLLSSSTDETGIPVQPRRRSIRPRPPRHMQRLYNACTGCYIVTLVTMVAMVVCSVIYYPQIPVYNICNDDVAWKSIIDSMVRMHTQADFEILASLSNPNHISVALDNGTGFFHHNGKLAGSFTIPPFTAQAMSITDILIIAHLSPGTWDAVQIAKEYSMGKLILHVNTSVVIRVPALADFTYEGQMDDIVVNVNEINDRSLCACPSWDDTRNHTSTIYDAIPLDLLTLP